MTNIFKKSTFTVSVVLENSKGSGFFFCYKGNMYVVTARHVLFREKEGSFNLYANAACIKAPDTKGKDADPAIFENLLNDNNTYYNKTYDVGLIHLGSYRLKNNKTLLQASYREETIQTQLPTNMAQFYGEYSAVSLNDVHVGTDIFIAGYPTSLGITQYMDFFDHDRPVVRKGIVSHVNYKKQHIIIDCFVFPGNSGGPVIQATNDEDLKHTLIGLVSRYIPYRQIHVIPVENITNINYVNSGYALIVSMDHILESMIDFSKRLPDPYDGKKPDDWDSLF
jgi:V8-like Glu-specific endopeptidase